MKAEHAPRFSGRVGTGTTLQDLFTQPRAILRSRIARSLITFRLERFDYDSEAIATKLATVVVTVRYYYECSIDCSLSAIALHCHCSHAMWQWQS